MKAVGQRKVTKGKLDANSPKLGGQLPYQGVKMKFTAGKQYALVMKSKQVETIVAVRAAGQERPLAGALGKDTATLLFAPPNTGQYEVMALTKPGNTGNFEIIVQELRTVIKKGTPK